MRGSPPFHLALLLIAFMGLAVPLVQLTAARTYKPMAATLEASPHANEGNRVNVLMTVRFAHVPKSLNVEWAGKNVLTDLGGQTSPAEVSMELDLPPEGLELHAKAEWPAGTPDTALTIEVEPEALDKQSQTRWSSEGVLNEVIPFVWKP